MDVKIISRNTYYDGYDDYESDEHGTGVVYERGSDNRLVSNLKCSVEINEPGSLSFTIHKGHPLWGHIEKYCCVITAYDPDDAYNYQYFYGRVTSSTINMDGSNDITCEGILGALNDVPVSSGIKNMLDKTDNLDADDPGHGWTVTRAFEAAMEIYSRVNRDIYGQDNPYGVQNGYISPNFGTLDSVKHSFSFNGDSCYDLVHSLIDLYGGVLIARNSGTPTEPVVNIFWLANNIGGDYDECMQRITYGENLLSVEAQETDRGPFITGISPVGTDKNGDTIFIQQDSGTSHAWWYWAPFFNESMVLKYGVIYEIKRFDNAKTEANLRACASKWVETNVREWPMTFKIKAIDRHMFDSSVDRFKLLNRIHVDLPPHMEIVFPEGQVICTAIDYDFFNPENTTYTLGPIIPPSVQDYKRLFPSKKKKKK